MRHVDDAHHAEGDGKADRGEQQHRAERDAVPDVLRRHPRTPGRPRCRRSPCRDRVSGVGIDRWRAAVIRMPIASRPPMRRRSCRSRRAFPRRRGRRPGATTARASSMRGLDLGVRFLGDARFRAGRDFRRSAICRTGCGRLQADVAIGAQQRQAAERGADGAAQIVVDLDLGDVALGSSPTVSPVSGSMSVEIAAPPALVMKTTLPSDLRTVEIAVGQALRARARPRIAGRGERVDSSSACSGSWRWPARRSGSSRSLCAQEPARPSSRTRTTSKSAGGRLEERATSSAIQRCSLAEIGCSRTARVRQFVTRLRETHAILALAKSRISSESGQFALHRLRIVTPEG